MVTATVVEVVFAAASTPPTSRPTVVRWEVAVTLTTPPATPVRTRQESTERMLMAGMSVAAVAMMMEAAVNAMLMTPDAGGADGR